jgi:UDP-N-acetylmuramate dehydrogenase
MPLPEWLLAWPGLQRDEPVAKHSQYGIGGPADAYLKVHDVAVLGELLPRCREAGVPVTVLGAGSNTLVLDGGIRGLAIQVTDRRLRVLGDDVAELSAGCMMPRAALDLARRGLAGMEFGIGVPGTCGASVRGNAGAFGTEVKDVLVDCDTIGPDGAVHTLSNAECAFAYRDSRFKGDLGEHVVIAARFRVQPGNPATVRARTEEITAQRKATQPWGIRSLGSVFKNPPDDFAGRLLDGAGLRGRRLGGAQISPKHANFIVNAHAATAADVLALIALAHDAVEERFGVDLEREIVVLGEPA